MTQGAEELLSIQVGVSAIKFTLVSRLPYLALNVLCPDDRYRDIRLGFEDGISWFAIDGWYPNEYTQLPVMGYVTPVGCPHSGLRFVED